VTAVTRHDVVVSHAQRAIRVPVVSAFVVPHVWHGGR
jgi:hypothetical protein